MRIIFSVFQKGQSNRVNLSNHKLVRRQLNGQLITEVVGCYKGEKELLFMVRVNGAPDIGRVITLCKEFNQESYLVLHESTDEAEVIECGTGDVLLSGTWNEINSREIEHHVAWTKVRDYYYVIDVAS